MSGLDQGAGATDLFLHLNGQVAKTLSIPPDDHWVVDMLERMANRGGEAGDVQYWCGEMNVSPENMVGALDYLVGQGFLERVLRLGAPPQRQRPAWLRA